MNKKETKQLESLEQKLLGLLRAHARSMHVGELRKLMMMGKQEHGELADQLGLMAEAGLVTELPGGKYRAPKQPGRVRDAAADGGSRLARGKRGDAAADSDKRHTRGARGGSADNAAADGGERGRGAFEQSDDDSAASAGAATRAARGKRGGFEQPDDGFAADSGETPTHAARNKRGSGQADDGSAEPATRAARGRRGGFERPDDGFAADSGETPAHGGRNKRGGSGQADDGSAEPATRAARGKRGGFEQPDDGFAADSGDGQARARRGGSNQTNDGFAADSGDGQTRAARGKRGAYGAADQAGATRGGDFKTRRRAERVARRRVAELQTRSGEHGGALATARTRDTGRRTQATGADGAQAPYRAPRARSELVGRLNVNTRGFGFVTPEEPGPDIFIPPPALGSALHGDKVRVRVFPSPKGFDGQVLEVIERATHYIGGQLLMLPYATFIEPDDERLKARVQVVGQMPDNVRTGQGVIAKVVGFPDHPGEPLLASIVEAFEAAEFAEFEIRRILLSQAVREDFAEDVQAEAREYGDHVTAADCEGRVDYRDLELLTIDPDDARDHDDAVYAEPAPGGGYRVIVAIADVSHYVKPDTALDREALARGCTIYLPSRAIPMLPRELSSHLASLVPHEDRLALAVDLELDNQGHVRKHKFVECVMRSAARLSYGGVARALGMTEDTELQPAAESRKPQLQLLLEVAKLLGAQRKSRGSLDFDLPEAKVKLNPETGEPVSIERSRTDPGVRSAYNLIEEMMLLANEVVARDLSKRKVAAIYRVHGAPNEEKVLAFAELAGSFGFKIDDDIAEQPGKLAKFLATVADTPHAEVLSYLLLRAMQQATYATDNIGHFGLAAEDYVHFTSPIRRYPDLAIHRIVRKIARGEPLHGKKLKTELAEQAAESSRLERRAMLIEREVVDLYRAMLMRDRVGEEFEATITGITEHGIFAAIESPCVDVFCRLQSLPPDHYESDQYGTRLVGLASGRTFSLFDRIAVRIEDVSVARRRISAVPVEVLASPAVEQHAVGRPRRKSTKPPKRGGPQAQTSHKGRPRNERDQRRHAKESKRKQKSKGNSKRKRR